MTKLDCGHSIEKAHEYGTFEGKSFCYACCAKRDEEQMEKEGRITLYLTNENGTALGTISNWPGSLKIKNVSIRKGRHNIARTRYDVWFIHKNREWHGVQYGDNTQLLHCRRLAKNVKRLTQLGCVVA